MPVVVLVFSQHFQRIEHATRPVTGRRDNEGP